MGYGKSSVQCCGEHLEPVSILPCAAAPSVTSMDGEYLLEYKNPMTKEDHIAAIVVERYDRAEMVRLFAEQSPQVRVAQVKGARIIALYHQHDKVWAEEYKG